MAGKSIWNHQNDLSTAEGRIYEEICKYKQGLLSGEEEDKEKVRRLYEEFWKHQEVLLSEEEKEKKKRERRVGEEIFKYQQGLLAGEKEDKEKVRRLSEELSKLQKVVVLSKEEEEKKEKDRQIWEEVWKRQKDWLSLTDEEEKKKKDEEIYEFLWNHQKQYLSEEETEKKIKERQTYLELKQKAIDNPLSQVPFYLFGPGCVMPNFEETYREEELYELRGQRPLTEEEQRRIFPPGMRVNLPTLPPLPWDNRETVPLTPEIAHQIEEQRQLARCTTVSPIVMSREEKQKQLAAQGRCLDGSYLNPYCKCEGALHSQCCGFEPIYPPDFAPIWLAYKRQIRQSHCFDIDDHPGSPFGASVGPLAPSHDFNGEAELLMELAKRAILEYNEKECNVLKYKVLKIEKVSHSVMTYYQYWMTVKVLNLTLGTPTETFQVHAGKSIFTADDKVIYCCRPKEEAIVGLPSCEICFGLLHREEAT